MWFCQAEHCHTQFATMSNSERACTTLHQRIRRKSKNSEKQKCTDSYLRIVSCKAKHYVSCLSGRPHSSKSRNAVKGLPLLSGSSIKWETYRFSLEESVITCRVHEGCRFSENYMLAWFSIIAYSQPSVVHRQMKLGAGRTKGGRIPRSAVVLWIQLDETRFSQNGPVLVLSDHGQRAASCCLEFEMTGVRRDLVLGHHESLMGYK